MANVKHGNTTHIIPDDEDARHYADRCYCHPTVQVVSHLPEGWHEYDHNGNEVHAGRVITHKPMKITIEGHGESAPFPPTPEPYVVPWENEDDN